jgi:hypothetical protein
MTPDEIDDALGRDPGIEPTPAFGANVMRAVHARAALPPSQGRLAPAIWPVVAVASVAVALLAAVGLVNGTASRGDETFELVRWLSFTLTGTIAVAWPKTRRAA